MGVRQAEPLESSVRTWLQCERHSETKGQTKSYIVALQERLEEGGYPANPAPSTGTEGSLPDKK